MDEWAPMSAEKPQPKLSFDTIVQRTVEDAKKSCQRQLQTVITLDSGLQNELPNAAGSKVDGRSKKPTPNSSTDVTGTVEKCLKQTSSFLSAGQSVVVDNTNIDVESRSRFLAIAKQMNIPARALVMNTSPGNSRHNEMFRRLTGSSHDKINDMVFNMMKSKYKEPTTAEGFTEVLKIPFVPAPPDHLHDLYYQYLLEK
ncbi:unnamed protein product [Dibothriocephalus latus]|uniref:Uncharacterized protein n=1 Tax=Dibothriocephalus latus TaxID=60516 RepID=A0A3P7NMH9_DIBLA|nr:unnamed protein product [Dibothriocephalus latus]